MFEIVIVTVKKSKLEKADLQSLFLFHQIEVNIFFKKMNQSYSKPSLS